MLRRHQQQKLTFEKEIWPRGRWMWIVYARGVAKGEENVTHLLLECREVKRIWYVSPLRLIVECREGESFRDWVEKMLKVCNNGDWWDLFWGLCWSIWLARNEGYFSNTWKKVGWWLSKTVGVVGAYRKAMEGVNLSRGLASSGNVLWICPTSGVKKLNTDAAMRKDGFKALVVESDCLCVVEAIRRKRKHHSHLGLILNDIFALMEMCSPVSMSHVRRTGNGAAHSLAKMSFEWGELRVWLEDAPHQVLQIVEEDMRGSGGPGGLGGGCSSLRHTTLVCASTIGLLRVCDSAHEATPDTRLAVADLPPLPLIEMRD
ncbi:Gamma-glutamyl phosphate reductase [Bienertia sinuspersici]